MSSGRQSGRLARVAAIAGVTWIGCAGFVTAIGFPGWIAMTTAAILAGAMLVLGAVLMRREG